MCKLEEIICELHFDVSSSWLSKVVNDVPDTAWTSRRAFNTKKNTTNNSIWIDDAFQEKENTRSLKIDFAGCLSLSCPSFLLTPPSIEYILHSHSTSTPLIKNYHLSVFSYQWIYFILDFNYLLDFIQIFAFISFFFFFFH